MPALELLWGCCREPLQLLQLLKALTLFALLKRQLHSRG